MTARPHSPLCPWQLRSVAVFAVLTLVLLAPVGLLGQVLILFGSSSQAFAPDVKAKLLAASPQLGTITIFNAGTTSATPTPTLTTLLQYKAVLVFSDSGGFADPAAIGNVLANYVDAGGGVVEAVFANGSIPITGRWQASGYTAFNSGGQTSGSPLTLGTIHVPSSPIFAGVTTFNGGTSSYRSTGGLRTGATRLADWSNGDPLVALSPGFNGRIVSLNFFPPSSDARSDFWTASTGGAKLMANSLNFVAIPEPSALALLALGLGLVLWRQRRARAVTSPPATPAQRATASL